MRRTRVNGERGQEPSGAVEVEIAIDADSGWWQPAGADHVSRPAAVNVHPAVPRPTPWSAQNHVRRRRHRPKTPSARPRGEVLREVARVYMFRLRYLRGIAGIIIALAEQGGSVKG